MSKMRKKFTDKVIADLVKEGILKEGKFILGEKALIIVDDPNADETYHKLYERDLVNTGEETIKYNINTYFLD